MLHHAGEKLALENEPFRLWEPLPREQWLPGMLLYQITQTDVDMQSPLRADCWILILHRKAIIKAAPHQRWDTPPPPTSVQTNTQTLIYHPQAAEISHIYHYLPKVKTKSGGKAFPCEEKSAPILQFSLFPCNTSRSALQATNNRIGNLQSFNLTGALNI